ncbi:MAG: class I SAM-dependent methyltransferase [Ruminococcus sp.]
MPESKKLFSLDNRLSLCASLCREGVRLADIGTDHAYLPVYLTVTGKVFSAIAADINPLPLEKGKATVRKFGAESKVTTRLCPGLDSISPDEVDDIVIAGMGGETIISIIDNAPWLKDSQKRLILQPMSKQELLIEYLCKNGFEIICQKTCEADRKIYTAMAVSFSGKAVPFDESFTYTGKLDFKRSDTDRRYIEKQIKALRKKANADPHFGELANRLSERLGEQ